MMLSLLLLLAQSPPAPGLDAKPVGSVVVTSDRSHEALAHDLAKVLNSEELTRTQLRKMLGETLPRTFSADPSMSAMEVQYPGITNAMIGAMKPIITTEMIAMLPKLWNLLAPVYARRLTSAELGELLDFYRSPAGIRVIAAVGDGADYSDMVRQMLADENSAVTADALKSGGRSGIAEVIRRATPEDVAAMKKLGATSAGRKLADVTTEALAVTAKWSNEPSPEINAKLEAAITQVTKKFIDKGTSK